MPFPPSEDLLDPGIKPMSPALRADSLRLSHWGGKDSDAGRDWGQEEKGMTEDEMAGWHHQLYGHEFE